MKPEPVTAGVVNVNVELTDHCNLRCIMCSQALREQAHGRPKRFMDWSTWRFTLRGLEGIEDEVILCPHWLGEPTLHPHFEPMIEYAFAMNWGNRLFRHFKLHTNGVRLDAGRSRRLVVTSQRPGQEPDTFASIHFSVDAFSPDTYRIVKGADLRDMVYKNILTMLDICNASGSEWPKVHIAFVVQPTNAHEAKAFVDWWSEQLAIRGRRFSVTADWPGLDQDAIYLRALNCRAQEEAHRLHSAICERIGIRSSSPTLRSPESF